MIDKKELDDIFGIPQDGSHLDDDSGSTDDVAFGNLVNSNSSSKSFEDQVNLLKKGIESNNLSKKDLINKDDIKYIGGKANELQNKENGKPALKDDENLVASVSKANIEVHAKSNESLGNSLDTGESISEASVGSSKQKEKSSEIVLTSIKDWNTYTNNLAFISFYEMKKDALSGWLLPGGEIDFETTQSELISARVDLSSISFGDLHSMFDSLKSIQHWKDRVTEISLRVNAQYYSWKRAIDLFRGTLARMHYEKPAEKQDGVVMEHMGDMIRYFSQIESLHANVDAVTRNLDNAFDCISRQITISMPNGIRDSESVERKVSKNIDSNARESAEFADIINSSDRLNPPVANKKHHVGSFNGSKKSGTVEWNSF
jgi:hypothetical protein